MTDCTLFKPRITFPLCELLHYKIFIETELPATPWFPLMSEAAVNIKAGVTSLNWGQGVKLDNRLFVCGFLSLPLQSPGLGESTRGCERRAAEPPLTYHISQRETDTPMLRGLRKGLPEATDAANPPSNNSRTVSRVAVKSGESSLVVAVTGDVPDCRHWPSRCVSRAPQVRQQFIDSKQRPRKLLPPERRSYWFIFTVLYQFPPVPVCFWRHTSLWSLFLRPAVMAFAPLLLPPLPRLELTWLILFPRTGSSSCLQLW